MPHRVQFHPDFVPEWKELEMGLKELVGEVLDHLEDDGPFLGRPEVDTLNGSKHTNMKEVSGLGEKCGALRSPSILPRRRSFFAAPTSKAQARRFYKI
jgi:hypothetical protein